MTERSRGSEHLEADQISQALKRTRARGTMRRTIHRVVFGMAAASATVILLSILLFPPLRIYGRSMAPTLEEGQIIVAYKAPEYHAGDVVAFNCNNKILVKRVICNSGEWFNMRADGTILVNGMEIDEPYLHKNSFGPCDLELPYQVPDGRIFVLGDDRASSVDSRSQEIGCIPRTDIVGLVLIRIWPLDVFGRIE